MRHLFQPRSVSFRFGAGGPRLQLAFASSFYTASSQASSFVRVQNVRPRIPVLPLQPKRFAHVRIIDCVEKPEDSNNDDEDDGEDPEGPVVVPDTDTEERVRRLNALDSVSVAAPKSNGIPVPGAAAIVEVPFAPGKMMRFETGRIARQAAGSVVARMGDTMVFCTACAEKDSRPEADFVPLRVDYAEKLSSVGRTPGSYTKREGRPSDREILVSRLIDRPLRPMFEDGFFREVQVVSSVFSYDGQHPADALAICGSAAALHISQLPLVEPVAGVRISYVNGDFIVEPTAEEQIGSTADIVVAGTRSGILMIEGIANFLPEDEIIRGVRIAHESIVKLCNGIDELRAKAGKEKDISGLKVIPPELTAKIEQLMTGIDDALAVASKQGRDIAVKQIKNRVFAELKPSRQEEVDDPDAAVLANTILTLAWNNVVKRRLQAGVLESGIRADGRDLTTVRPITIDQGILPGAHGSSLFTRGETQALVVATLGGEDMGKRSESLEGEETARFYLQYSFLPSSVGEVGRIGAPGRREIGHGKLAERALAWAVPEKADFPYTIRVESQILESNGSSSMASVCGATLALLEAGVPLKKQVAGVAMGLILDKQGTPDEKTGELPAVILTDILGLEDALGSCDAKFAGDADGLSALQLDVKLRGISVERLQAIMEQARDGRRHILGEMQKAMPEHKSTLPDNVPRIKSVVVPPNRIGDVIGSGGKNIRSIIEQCGGESMLRIHVEDDGTVSVSSTKDDMMLKAIDLIKACTIDLTVGTNLSGTITKTLPFGAYVEVAQGREGWLHISELENKRTENVEDVVSVGDKVEVKVIESGRNGSFKLSRRALLPKPARQNSPEPFKEKKAPVNQLGHPFDQTL